MAFFVAGSWPICGFPVANLWLSRHSRIASSHHLILGIFYPFLVQTCTVLSLRRKHQQKPAHKPAAGRRIPGFRAARSMSDADPLFAMPSLGSYSARHPSDVKVFATTNRGAVSELASQHTPRWRRMSTSTTNNTCRHHMVFPYLLRHMFCLPCLRQCIAQTPRRRCATTQATQRDAHCRPHHATTRRTAIRR